MRRINIALESHILRLFSSLLFLLFFGLTAHAVELPFDPYLWMEEVHGERPLQWVQEQNKRTMEMLEKEPMSEVVRQEMRNILLNPSNQHIIAIHEGNYFWKIFRNANNIRGLLYRATLEEYKKEEPQWEFILDIDALSKAENVKWTLNGHESLDEKSKKILIRLSREGKDAIEIREFDTEKKEFVQGGFFIPEAKTRFDIVDENNLIVGTDYGPGTTSTSGYPLVFKLLKRGQSLAEAETIYDCRAPEMISCSVTYAKHEDIYFIYQWKVGKNKADVLIKKSDGTIQKLFMPKAASLVFTYDKFVYIQFNESWRGSKINIPANSIVRFPMGDRNLNNAEIIFTAEPKQKIDQFNVYKKGFLINLMVDVKSRMLKLTQDSKGKWTTAEFDFPQTGSLSYDNDGLRILTYTDYLTPKTQYLINGEETLELLLREASDLNTSELEAIQYFAKSADGTRVPYTVIKKKTTVYDGTNPTVLNGYGGFAAAMEPEYAENALHSWVKYGGVYVFAGIRGGSEYGPKWHLAALKTKRHKSFEDFIAIAEDLIEQKITSPRHLGISGGSNGGLMVASVMVKRPELFNAVFSRVPLTDMARFAQLMAGSSWVSEYGDPKIQSECEYLLSYSPYHNVSAGQKYPSPLFVTSTADDRVHPGHARKMALKMIEQGHHVYFYEWPVGGHSLRNSPELGMENAVLQYSYFWSRLR